MPRGGRGRHHHRHRGGGGGWAGQMGHVPTLPIPFYLNSTVTYAGHCAGFILHLNNMLPEEKLAVKVLNLRLYGEVVQEFSSCCFIFTLVAGGFCFFPYCLLCCDCYKRSVYEQRSLALDGYAALATAIAAFPSLENVIVFVNDSLLDAQKAAVLERALLSVPKLVSFSFLNQSGNYDNQGREYSDFETYFAQFRQANKGMYAIVWGTKVLNNTGNAVANAIGNANALLGMNGATMEMTQYPLASNANPVQVSPYQY